MTKLFHQLDIIINIYELNNRASSTWVKNVKFQGEVDKLRISAENLNALFSVFEKTNRKKISSHTEYLKNTSN